MSQRVQQGGRPGGSRYAQFKLVLLGMLRYSRVFAVHIADNTQVNPLLERFAALSRQPHYELTLTCMQSSLVLRFVKVGPQQTTI